MIRFFRFKSMKLQRKTHRQRRQRCHHQRLDGGPETTRRFRCRCRCGRRNRCRCRRRRRSCRHRARHLRLQAVETRLVLVEEPVQPLDLVQQVVNAVEILEHSVQKRVCIKKGFFVYQKIKENLSTRLKTLRFFEVDRCFVN